VYPDDGAGAEHHAEPTVFAPSSGVVNHIGHDALVELAGRAHCRLELVPALGEFVPAGAPLFRVVGDPVDLDEKAVTKAVVLGLERTLDQDVAYGFRMLVDIAERSLAESAFVDPTTAVQAIDRLHDCLRQMAPRPFPDGIHRDDAGVARLVIRAMTWDAYVDLAFEEIRLAGAGSPQVTRRLQAALDDLRTVAPADRRAVLDRHAKLLHASADAAVTIPDDLMTALAPDALGFGTPAASAPLEDVESS
jgi:uncharacterized membrane protein